MFRNSLLIVAVSVAVWTFGAAAVERVTLSTNPPNYDPLSVRPIVFYDKPALRPQRIELANRLLKAFRAIDLSIANLSPAQRQWINTEYYDALAANGKRISQRILDAQNTVEFSTHIIKDHYTYNLIPILSHIAREDGTKLKDEILDWSYVSKKLTSPAELQTALTFISTRNSALKNVIEESHGFGLQFYALNMGLRSLEIQERILEPFISGELKS